MIAGLLVAVALVLGSVLGAAHLAALVAGQHLHASLTDAGAALARLPRHLSDPALAWPPNAAAVLPGPVAYWACQLIVLMFDGAIALLAWKLFGSRRERDGLGVDRSARFANRSDIRRLAVPGPVPGRLILGRAGSQLVATEPRTSVCVIGPSQSGKTSGLCVPTLLELEKGGGAVIAATVKEDLWRITAGRRGQVGEVKVFDPTSIISATTKSATWSPLRNAASITGAQSAARGLVMMSGDTSTLKGGDFWSLTAYDVLWPMLYLARNTSGTMRDVVSWLTTHDFARGIADPRSEGQRATLTDLGGRIAFLEDAAAGPPEGEDPRVFERDVAQVRDTFVGLAVLADETRSGVYTTARNSVQAWSSPAMAATDGYEITPEWLLKGDNTLYIIAPAKEQEAFVPVFAGMVADLVNTAFDVATRNGGTLDRPLLVMLDEAANICPIRELPSWCSTCPSHGITLMTAWQDFSQQRAHYGDHNAQTIWNNSGARLILSGLSDEALAELPRRLGEEEHQRKGTSTDVGREGRSSVSTQISTRNLIGGDSIRQQAENHALLVYRNLPPVQLRLRPWHADPRLKALQERRAQPIKGQR